MIFDYKDKGTLMGESGLQVVNGDGGERGGSAGHFLFSNRAQFRSERYSVVGENGYGRGACFRNFPHLRVKGLHLLDCTFENCGKVEFDECDVINCTFRAVERIEAMESKFTHCTFEELKGDGESIMDLDETVIRKSTFRNIALCGEAYLCESDFESTVEECDFRDCSTDREDLELFFCLLETGVIFRRKKEVSIALSCTGLDKVRYTGESDEDDEDDEDW